jgi:hypothetical protein
VQPPLDSPSRPRPKVTQIWRLSNYHRAIVVRQTVVPTNERTIRRANLVRPSRDLFFPGKRRAYEGVGPPGWSVTAFHVPHLPSSTIHEEHSTQPRPPGRPLPYPDTTGQPRRATSPRHQ